MPLAMGMWACVPTLMQTVRVRLSLAKSTAAASAGVAIRLRGHQAHPPGDELKETVCCADGHTMLPGAAYNFCWVALPSIDMWLCHTLADPTVAPAPSLLQSTFRHR
jgi:hypothetical protein